MVHLGERPSLGYGDWSERGVACLHVMCCNAMAALLCEVRNCFHCAARHGSHRVCCSSGLEADER